MIQGVIIAMVISMDSLGIGVIYGMKNIRISAFSLVVIHFIAIVLLTMGFESGNILRNYFSETLVELIGAGILIGMGIHFLLQGLRGLKEKDLLGEFAIDRVSVEERVNFKVSVILGFALGVDSLGIGIAAPPSSPIIYIWTMGVALFTSLTFFIGGWYMGREHLAKKLEYRTSLIPGVLMIALGLIRLL